MRRTVALLVVAACIGAAGASGAAWAQGAVGTDTATEAPDPPQAAPRESMDAGTYAVRLRDLEQRLKQGKISFASPKRMDKYLGLSGGSVSIFGLINDHESHVHVFLDETLKSADKISFHPNDNTATLVISFEDFMKYLDAIGNPFEFIQLYD